MFVRKFASGVAIASLLLIVSRSAAQPAPQDQEKRMRALEEKMDRVLKILDPQPKADLSPEALERTYQLLMQATETLEKKVQVRQQEYTDFRHKNPFTFMSHRPGDNLFSRRLDSLEKSRTDLLRRNSEVESKIDLIKKAAESESAARAMLVYLQRQGVDVPALQRAAAGPRGEVGPVDLLKTYMESLRLEREDIEFNIRKSDILFDRESRALKDLNSLEVEEERLRKLRDQSDDMLRVVVKRMQEISIVRDLKK